MNKVLLIGTLTKDAEFKQANEETSVARFTVAINRRVREGQEQTADFISCVAFNKRAEFLSKFGKKGTKFGIEGHIQTGSYTNRDGQKVYTTDVVVEQIEFAQSKKSDDTNASQPESDGFMNIPDGIDEELPFV